jgi:hypothetical protein
LGILRSRREELLAQSGWDRGGLLISIPFIKAEDGRRLWVAQAKLVPIELLQTVNRMTAEW